MKKVPGNDSFQRINYLYQISKYMVDKNPALSSYYGNLIVNVAKKNVLKIHPDIKRQLCKKCRCILVDGTSASMKIKTKNKKKAIEWTCHTCGNKRNFPADKDKDHRLWVERDEAVVEPHNANSDENNGAREPNEISFFPKSRGGKFGVDYDALKYLKKDSEWAKKHRSRVKAEKEAFEDAHNARAQNVPGHQLIYLSEFKKGDGVDQVIPQEEPTPDEAALTTVGVNFFHMDPVLNALRRQSKLNDPPVETNLRYDFADENLRRSIHDSASSSDTASSSVEMKNFKDEFREVWLHKKFEALNKSQIREGGDNVNMLAARPWGVPCGDPNQHDMPWGTCIMAAECTSEFRIYRGDFFCGRTQFVCCGLQLSSYDLYQGFDASFDDKSLSTDSDERRERKRSSKEKKQRRKKKERKNRKKERERRKKKIRTHIKKIVKEMKKILDKQYKNGTKQRKSRTKQLKKFIKDLKKQYRKDRQSVKDLHTHDMIHIDKRLLDRLKQIQSLNTNFAKNETFRQIILKEMLTKDSARMLVQAYPELDEFLEVRRRSGGGGLPTSDDEDSKEGNLQYDVEYGYLYY
ncbi:RNAse P rpr2/Rpp21/SNM1 subunit domain-containing protein [Phthorimaea operculella]|nr:RNAse P rpr2/Rpp21/SNM1 subunit domain-containing protein [Phthorimaea operculella]